MPNLRPFFNELCRGFNGQEKGIIELSPTPDLAFKSIDLCVCKTGIKPEDPERQMCPQDPLTCKIKKKWPFPLSIRILSCSAVSMSELFTRGWNWKQTYLLTHLGYFVPAGRTHQWIRKLAGLSLLVLLTPPPPLRVNVTEGTCG